MPGRTLQPINTADPAELMQRMQQIQGMFDDPIAQVRVTAGALASFTRKVSMQVVDRLDQIYEPRSFERTGGVLSGRWMIQWYYSATQFGTPTAPTGISVVTGTDGGQHNSVPIYYGITDTKGLFEFNLNRGSFGDTWIHASIVSLLRAKGFNWQGGTAIVPNPPPASGSAGVTYGEIGSFGKYA